MPTWYKKKMKNVWFELVTHCDLTPQKYLQLMDINTMQCFQWLSVQTFPGHILQLQWVGAVPQPG